MVASATTTQSPHSMIMSPPPYKPYTAHAWCCLAQHGCYIPLGKASPHAIVTITLSYPKCEEPRIDSQPTPPPPHPTSPAAARAALHQLIDRFTDDEAMAMWRLICSWVVEDAAHRPAAPEDPRG
jgi:hypothetical protein